MTLTPDEQEALRVADGAERSRRAAWAMFFDASDRERQAQSRYDQLVRAMADAVLHWLKLSLRLAVQVKFHPRLKVNDPAVVSAQHLIDELSTHPHGTRLYEEAVEEVMNS